MKKLIFLCLFALFAESVFAFEYNIGGEAKVSTDVYSINSNSTGIDSATGDEKRPTITQKVFGSVNIGDTNFKAVFAWPVFGIQFVLKPFHHTPGNIFAGELSKWYYTWFDDTYMWYDFMNVTVPAKRLKNGFTFTGRLQVGEYESGVTEKFNSVLDEWGYGSLWYKATDATNINNLTSGDYMVNSDLLKHFILTFGFGPVKFDWSPVNLGMLDITSRDIFQRGGVMQFRNGDDRTIVSTFRLYTDKIAKGWLRLSATYGLVYDWQRAKRSAPIGRTNTEKVQFINRYGAVVELYTPIKLDLTLSYAGYVNEYARDFGSSKTSYKTDTANAFEFRIRYLGVKNLTLETHHKFSFGKDIGNTINDNFTNAGNFYVESKFPEMRAFWNGLGASYKFLDKYTVSLVVANKFAEISSKTTGDVYNIDQFVLKPAFQYDISDNAYIKLGVNFTYTKTSGKSGGKEVRNTSFPATTFDVAVPLTVYVKFPSKMVSSPNVKTRTFKSDYVPKGGVVETSDADVEASEAETDDVTEDSAVETSDAAVEADEAEAL